MAIISAPPLLGLLLPALMERPLRIGVLGAGHLGRMHVQQLRELTEYEIVRVFDPRQEKAEN